MARYNHPLYATWNTMIARCYRPANNSYKRYGAKGVTVCQRWRDSFDDFVSDVGPRPSLSHSIDRKDNARGYEPDNVQWSTRKEQTYNSSWPARVIFNGESRVLAELAHERGLNPHTVWCRVNRYGWSLEDALSKPNRRLVEAANKAIPGWRSHARRVDARRGGGR